jgi:hypothetical protein
MVRELKTLKTKKEAKTWLDTQASTPSILNQKTIMANNNKKCNLISLRFHQVIRTSFLWRLRKFCRFLPKSAEFLILIARLIPFWDTCNYFRKRFYQKHNKLKHTDFSGDTHDNCCFT